LLAAGNQPFFRKYEKKFWHWGWKNEVLKDEKLSDNIIVIIFL
jgi:hypothetical protein